jgi:hypothetical protein
MAKSKPKPAPPPAAAVERVPVLNLKGSPAYRDWLAAMSKQTMIPVASIVRDALGKWAESRGFPEPPEL